MNLMYQLNMKHKNYLILSYVSFLYLGGPYITFFDSSDPSLYKYADRVYLLILTINILLLPATLYISFITLSISSIYSKTQLINNILELFFCFLHLFTFKTPIFRDEKNKKVVKIWLYPVV
jgi:hypothetical protein